MTRRRHSRSFDEKAFWADVFIACARREYTSVAGCLEYTSVAGCLDFADKSLAAFQERFPRAVVMADLEDDDELPKGRPQ